MIGSPRRRSPRRLAAAGLLAPVLALAPSAAFAAEGEGAGRGGTLLSIVQSLTSDTQTLIVGICLAIAGLVAGGALLAILIEVVPMLFAKERRDFNEHIKNALKVLAVAVIAGAAVLLVNAAVTFVGGGMNLGNISLTGK